MSDEQDRQILKALGRALLDRDEAAAATHTPGPWRVDHERITGPGEGTVAIWSGQGLDPFWTAEDLPLENANARLIVAAPTLLAAAQRIVEALDVFKRCPWCALHGYEMDPDAHTDTCWVPTLRAAIKQANDG